MFWNRSPAPAQIAAGFRKRAPWVTRFIIHGQPYGGQFDAEHDVRIRQFFEVFPSVRRLLELGCLEWGHTFQLAKHTDLHITAVDARHSNLSKARYVSKLLGVQNVSFVQADLEKRALSSFGQFDAVFCSGLLYHLPRPWDMLDGLRAAAPRVFIWTHYAAEDRATETNHGFRGHWYQEHGPADPLSGMSPKSFWITLPSIVERLNRNGFESVTIIADEREHPHGPCVTLAAWTGAA